MSRTLKAIVIIAVVLVATGLTVFLLYRTGVLSFGKKGEAKPKEYTYLIGEFTVNLNEPGYKRYIKVTPYAGCSSKKMEAEISEKMPQIRNIINDILRSKRIEDVDTTQKTDALRDEMKEKINTVMAKGTIMNIYLDEILIQ